MQKNMLLAFNRGQVSKLGLARIDTSRMSYSAEEQTNILPRVLGSAMLRPGWQFLGATKLNNFSMNFPFVFSESDQALIEMSDSFIRVRVNDEIITRPAVSTAVSNGNFTSNLNDWTDADETGATSDFVSGGYMGLTGDGANLARRRQTLTVSGGDQNVEHALRIIIERGPVLFRLGSTSNGEEYIAETALGTGEHSLSFTPTGASVFVEFASRRKYQVLVDSCNIEADGPMQLATSYGQDDLAKIRMEQSGDVLYVAGSGVAANQYTPKKIERRGTRSWSFVDYVPETGPFDRINTSQTAMAPDGVSGTVTITASQPSFGVRRIRIGQLLRIASHGQTVIQSASSDDVFTDPVRATGVGTQRQIFVTITGTFNATVTLQYSVADPGAWVDVASYTIPTNTVHIDDLDNQIIYYRLGIKSGDYTSGTATCQLICVSGSITGICRITAIATSMSATAVVLKDFGGTTSSRDWWAGSWSDIKGYPSATALYEGRLWWAGRDKIWGSISDGYEDFDDEFEGDAGPISRNIGFGPIQNINWLLPLHHLLMGTAQNSARIAPAVINGNSPISARSSAYEDPLTPNNFNLKTLSQTGLFVDRSGQRLYALEFDGSEYVPRDLSMMTPDMNEVGIRRIAVQMKPDVRIHCVLMDGTASVLVFDRAENVAAWIPITTDGEIEDAAILPGPVEDQVYYVVRRFIGPGGVTPVRYVEKWAMESECQGGTLNKLADSFIEYSGASTTSITASHLIAKTVSVWADGRHIATTFADSGGVIELPEPVTNCIVGMTYTGRFKGAKLGAMFSGGLQQRRKISQMGLLLLNTHHRGVKYGPSFDKLYDLPSTIDSMPVAEDTIFEEFDHDLFAYGGDWSADSRLHLELNAPLPATLQAVALVVDG